MTKKSYSPECVEGAFPEVGLPERAFSEGRARLRMVAPCIQWERLTRYCKKRVRREEAMSTNPQGGSQPSVVLVHGAWADGSGWQGVYDLMRQDGHEVRVVQNPTVSLQEDVAATKMIIGEHSDPVVLVGHSYGGTVITEAGNDPNVAALVYIAGWVPDAGESQETLIARVPSGVPSA